MQKRYNVLFFDKSGTYLKTIKNEVLKNVPNIRSTINLGAGGVVLRFNENFDDFKTKLDLDFLVRAEIREFDEKNKDGQIVFSGFVSQIKPLLFAGKEEVQATFLGYGAMLARSVYRDGSGNAITETAVDPNVALENIISNFNAKYFNSIVWDSAKVEVVGTPISYTFDGLKWKDAIEKVRELSGGGYFWRIDPDRGFVFGKKSETPTHTFHRSKDVEEMSNAKTFEPILNSVRVYYAGGLFVDNEDAPSVFAFGEVFEKFEDTDIADSGTAGQWAAQLVTDGKDSKSAVKVKINETYNLESIKVGDTCQILGSTIDSNVFPDNMQIVAIEYSPTFCIIELETLVGNLSKAIRSLK